MDLRFYSGILWRRKYVVVAATIVAALVVYFGVSRLEATYVSSATLRLATVLGGGESYVEFDVLYSDRLMNTLLHIAASRPIMEAAYHEFNLVSFPEVDTELILNTELLRISVTDVDPARASQIANFIAEQLIERAQTANPGAGIGAAPLFNDSLRLSVIEPAVPSDTPVGPNVRLMLVMGVLAGALAGTGLAFIFENLDTRLYEVDEVERAAGLTVIGEIPSARGVRRVRFLFVIYPHAEAFRQLRTNLLAIMKEQNIRKLMIVSAQPQEGKSTITANLAFSLAQTMKRVLAIDADMRHPTLHEVFGVSNQTGLSDVLRGEVALQEAVQETQFLGVRILPSGTVPPNPAELLHSAKMAETMACLAQEYDIILVDTPAVLAVTDASISAGLTDAALMVVRRAQSRREAVADALKQMEKVNANVIGVALNNARQSNYRDYYSPRKNRPLLPWQKAADPYSGSDIRQISAAFDLRQFPAAPVDR